MAADFLAQRCSDQYWGFARIVRRRYYKNLPTAIEGSKPLARLRYFFKVGVRGSRTSEVNLGTSERGEHIALLAVENTITSHTNELDQHNLA